MKISIKEAFGRVDGVCALADDLDRLGGLLSDRDEVIFGSGMDALASTLENQAGMDMPVAKALAEAAKVLRATAAETKRRLEGYEIDF